MVPCLLAAVRRAAPRLAAAEAAAEQKQVPALQLQTGLCGWQPAEIVVKCAAKRHLLSLLAALPFLQGDFAAAIDDEWTIDAAAAVGNVGCFHPVGCARCACHGAVPAARCACCAGAAAEQVFCKLHAQALPCCMRI